MLVLRHLGFLPNPYPHTSRFWLGVNLDHEEAGEKHHQNVPYEELEPAPLSLVVAGPHTDADPA